ncbi:uncharacterized protein LOC133517860 [Cydia pomonella]|uniref:uncharacterized protein LOC133517860 n=1 Tax=Cydia pomonella TaxID=82600 RepID=UPI002ADE3BDB|nr:uncharacterized protein LOC133517860 [Cydia pomonella]
MSSCCKCESQGRVGSGAGSLPLICLVPRDGPGQAQAGSSKPSNSGPSANKSDFRLLDEDYIKKNFKLPQRALYLDPFRKPLITFPIGGPPKNFNMARKNKINQMILDGFLDPCEAISAPSVFPYATSDAEKRKTAEDDEEIIYILQLPDIESRCPVHEQTIRTPRFIWHSCKKSKKADNGEMKPGGGPMNKPKPWLLSRHTDFDLLSQW